MCRRSIAFVILTTILTFAGKGKMYASEPDFSMPTSVSVKAAAEYRRAVERHDWPAALRNLIDGELASSMIDATRLPDIINRIDSIALTATDPAWQSMLYMLEATVVSDYYFANRYVYDRRIPAADPEQDIRLWSGDRFKARVVELCNAATAPGPDCLGDVELKLYQSCVTHGNGTFELYPTVYDFVAYKSIDLISSIMYTGWREAVSALLDKLKHFHADNPDPLLTVELRQARFDEYPFAYYKSLYDKWAGKTTLSSLILTETPVPDINAETKTIGTGILTFSPDRYWLYNAINVAAKNAHDPLRPLLKSIAADIERSNAYCRYPRIINPSMPLSVEVTLVNMTEAQVNLYRLPDATDGYSFSVSKLNTLRPIAVRTVSVDAAKPFQFTQSVEFDAVPQGNYAVSISGIGIKSNYSNKKGNVIQCRELSAFCIGGQTVTAFAVDAANGTPVRNASLMCSKFDETTERNIGTTNADGMIKVKENCYRARFIKGNSRSPLFSINPYSEDRLRIGGSLMTELPLYHPGDTVRFVGVVFDSIGNDYNAVSDSTFTIVMRDANYQEAGRVQSISDIFGRVTGSFGLPKDRLNGMYTIQIETSGSNIYGHFEVSDYKAPTFEITLDKVQTDSCAYVRGKAATYSGAAVGNAIVSVSLSGTRWYRFNSTDFSTKVFTTHTGTDGRFELVIPADSLSDDKRMIYTADVQITSTNGESQKQAVRFAMGPSYRIDAVVAGAYNLNENCSVPVSVSDYNNSPADIAVNYSVKSQKDSTVLKTGYLQTPASIDINDLEPGIYEISITAPDAETYVGTLSIYRPDSDYCPVDKPVWLPVNRYRANSNGMIRLTLGSRGGGAVLVVVSSASGISSCTWHTVPAGMSHLQLNTGDPASSHEVAVLAVRNGSLVDCRALVSPSQPDGIRIHTESMRNAVTPGAEEQWTFRITDTNGRPVLAAMVMDIYNKALDALAPVASRLSIPYRQQGHVDVQPIYNHTYFDTFNSVNDAVGQSRFINLYSAPDWQFYGYSFGSPRLGALYNKALTVTASGKSMMTRGITMATDTDDSVTEEASVEMEAVSVAMTDSGVIPESDDYRALEVAQAAFRPDLTTDSDGNLTVTWRVPQANGAWAVRITAWNQAMFGDAIDTTLIASKPIMVQPNLPRYLRCGDRATVSVAIINRRDVRSSIKVYSEIFDIGSGQVLTTFADTVEVDDGATETISQQIVAPANMAMIGYRVKAVSESFSDGVRTALPLLPSSDPVIESCPLLLSASEAKAHIEMPAAHNAAGAVKTVVEYCDNPVWYVITALPGLGQDSPSTSVMASRQLFSAAVAGHLMTSYPTIGEALRLWLKNDSTPMLTSMLERDRDLKLMLLQATPWVRQAMSDTERMHRLALLLDTANIDDCMSRAISALQNLQMPDGGMRWRSEDHNSSLWATTQVLEHIATIMATGAKIPDGMSDVSRKALAYCDSAIMRMSADNTSDLFVDYAALRIRLVSVTPIPSRLHKILERSIDNIAAKWKKSSVSALPAIALTLHNYGRNDVAVKVLESLRQYTVTDTDGMTRIPAYENNAYGYITHTARALTAFAVLEPDAPEVTGLCQNLVIQKQTTEWGDGSGAVDAVYAILQAASSWVRPASPFGITVNGSAIAITPFDIMSGSLRSELPSVLGDNRIAVDITRTPGTPAWGGIVRRFSALSTTIKPSGCRDLSIDKELILPQGATAPRVGMKATVRLIIKAGRNMNYVSITDNRAACMEPVQQIPGYVWSDGIGFYLENRDTATNIYVGSLPKGVYILTYDVYLNNAGIFASGIASAQCMQTPELAAHSGGSEITVNR